MKSSVTSMPMDPQTDHDWQTTKNTVLERSCHMFNNPVMSDIKFTCGESKRKLFHAHKYVLATSSPVFYAMFYGGLATKDQIINLPDAEEESLEEFLRFLYTDECKLTTDMAIKILYQAKKFIIPALSTKCLEVLSRSIIPENVFKILEVSKQFSGELEQKCWRVIDEKGEEAIASEAIARVSHSTFGTLLKRDTLKINEASLFKAVLRWTEHRCSEENIELTGQNRRAFLGKLLYEIRFLSMTESQFAHEVSCTGILTPEESLSVFQIFNGLSNPSIPWKQFKRGIKLVRRPRHFPIDISPPDGSSWGYSGCADRICFSVSKNILFHGVHLFGNPNGGKYQVNLEIEGTTVCGTFSSEFVRHERYSWYGFDVILQTPVKIQKEHVVQLLAQIDGPPSYYFNAGAPVATTGELQVTFSKSEILANGTDEKRGQFYEIIVQIDE